MSGMTLLMWSLGVSGAVIAASEICSRVFRRDQAGSGLIEDQVCPHCRMLVPVSPIHGDGFIDFICTRCYSTVHLHIYEE